MRYHQLGESDLWVSELCLGTMTYGQQNSLDDAHQQLDWAIAHGINFIDTAEMYPVPARAETQGATEEYIGQWLVQQQRDRLIVATKVAGPARGLKWIRGGPKINRQQITQAVDDSLKRLQTDYIDLYQIHWSDRYIPIFGQTVFDPNQERESTPIAEQLQIFADLIQAGKIRYIGLSNETPWGVCEFSHIAKQLGLPKVISIQNAYNLINRVFDSALAEACYRENLGLLAYSPLGFGSLTGKYLQHQPENARLTLFSGFGARYFKVNVEEAIAAYADLAYQFGLEPSVMAIAFVRSRWFVTSTIIGATSLEQLQQNFKAIDVELDKEILTQMDAIHARYPNPAP